MNRLIITRLVKTLWKVNKLFSTATLQGSGNQTYLPPTVALGLLPATTNMSRSTFSETPQPEITVIDQEASTRYNSNFFNMIFHIVVLNL